MPNRPPLRPLALLALLASLLSGCGIAAHLGAPTTLKAQLTPTKGSKTSGLMTFRQEGKEVLIQGTFSGLTPGAHGLHIHEGADCGGPAARNAGWHFNPNGTRHGSPGSPSHHLGDLPMLHGWPGWHGTLPGPHGRHDPGQWAEGHSRAHGGHLRKARRLHHPA
jgi:Cu/Zn superoxide dismutase